MGPVGRIHSCSGSCSNEDAWGMKRLEELNIFDRVVLKNLHKSGTKTRSQLVTLGMTPYMIDYLTKEGILVKSHNAATNLKQYTVNDDLFGTK